MVLAIAWHLRTASIPRLTGTQGAAALVHHFTLCVHGAGGVGVPPTAASRWGCAHARSLVPWHRTSARRPQPGSSGTQAGLASLLHLPQPARARPRVAAGIVPGGGLSGGGRPLTACPSWLLQMGGGARQAREPADHGGHAAGGKRSRLGEAGGRAPRWQAEAAGQFPAQPLLRGAWGLSHLPRFGAGRAPRAHSCRKPGLRSPIAVSATQACARGLGPRQGW